MNKLCLIIALIILQFFCLSCKHSKNTKAIFTKKIQTPKTIILQPLGQISDTLTLNIYHQLKQIFPKIIIKKNTQMPAMAYYPARQRYRADSIIHYLHQHTPSQSITIGITTQDISTTKEKVTDWGVMGLGYCPGNACVASSFRLHKNKVNDELFKIAIHELGHTQGLPHCPNKTCFMQDAEGKNTTGLEHEFCKNCKQILIQQGWKI